MPRKKKEPHLCEKCNKDFDELVSREGFRTTYFVDFVCKDCFKELENCTYEEYCIEED